MEGKINVLKRLKILIGGIHIQAGRVKQLWFLST